MKKIVSFILTLSFILAFNLNNNVIYGTFAEDLPETGEEIVLTAGSVLSIDKENGFIYGRPFEMITAESVMASLKEGNIVIKDKTGSVIEDMKSFVSTGCSICSLNSDETVFQSLDFVIKGDVNGDRRFSVSDYLIIKRFLSGTFMLDGASSQAADTDGDSEITSNDHARVKAFFKNAIPTHTESSMIKKHIKTTEIENFGYWLYTPSDPAPDMPLIVYLHGGSGKGSDLDQITEVDGFPKYLLESALGNVRAYVIIPQLPSTLNGWINAKAPLKELITFIEKNYSIDKKNVSLTGHSMGGTGTWNIALEYPDMFSRIAPMSGSVRNTAANIEKLKSLPVWAFVGSADTVVSPASSISFIDALKAKNAKAQITVFEGAAHVDVPALAYLDTDIDIVGWLITVPDDEDTDDGMNMFDNSDFIEKEQPELTEETKARISAYHGEPTMENYLVLRDIVIENYNAVLDRKESKLAELIEETAGKPGGEAKVAEMREIVQEMYMTYWNRINSSMLRFTDSRLLKWNISSAYQYDYIPVMGAGNSIYVKRTPVTSKEYAEFIAATGHSAPSNWVNGTYPEGEDDYPVNFVSYADAEAYCDWLTGRDGVNVYRMPSESEWELAAGHMPKDADFNCGVNDGRVSVYQYASVTRGAHGAVDFWGNVWEWTSTERKTSTNDTVLGVKGGAWNSARTDCRTEHRKEGRNASFGYEDVGFRVIQVIGGTEPEQNVDLYTLEAPDVSFEIISSDYARLVWEPIDSAVEYQIFEYDQKTDLLRMVARTNETSFYVIRPQNGDRLGYIVQALSYTGLSDNVYGEYAIMV